MSVCDRDRGDCHLTMCLCVTETAETARRLEDIRKRELFAELKDQMEKKLEVG